MYNNRDNSCVTKYIYIYILNLYKIYIYTYIYIYVFVLQYNILLTCSEFKNYN